ncbi:MAG: hypothetical protein U0990_04055 [Candidatus Nanopelagicales bacterium]|nr:hypothetical protein [Candidatus Nanopelagicales bacterium]
MDKNSKMFREEYLPDWQLANKYRAMLLAEAGIWNEQQSNAYLTECQATLENWLLDNPLPRPWWKLWRPAV